MLQLDKRSLLLKNLHDVDKYMKGIFVLFFFGSWFEWRRYHNTLLGVFH